MEDGQPYTDPEEVLDAPTGPLPKGAKVVLDPASGSSGKFPGVWTIVKINQASYQLEQYGVPLRAHKSLVRLATGAEITAFASQPRPVSYVSGQLVRLPRARKMDGVYVVLSVRGLNPTDKVKVAKLGGENGRSWTVSRGLLEPFSLAELAEALRPHLTSGMS